VEVVQERLRGSEIARVDLPCRTSFVPIFTNRSRNVVIDRFATSDESARLWDSRIRMTALLCLFDLLVAGFRRCQGGGADDQAKI